MRGSVSGAGPQVQADLAEDPMVAPASAAMDTKDAVAQSKQGRQSSCPAR